MKHTKATPPGKPSIHVDASEEFVSKQLKETTDLEAYMKANEYKYKRVEAYPSIPEQLDMIYHEGLDAWKTKIKKIKDKYPKG